MSRSKFSAKSRMLFTSMIAVLMVSSSNQVQAQRNDKNNVRSRRKLSNLMDSRNGDMKERTAAASKTRRIPAYLFDVVDDVVSKVRSTNIRHLEIVDDVVGSLRSTNTRNLEMEPDPKTVIIKDDSPNNEVTAIQVSDSLLDGIISENLEQHEKEVSDSILDDLVNENIDKSESEFNLIRASGGMLGSTLISKQTAPPSEEPAAAVMRERGTHMKYNLPRSAEDWCTPPKTKPLPYEECTNFDAVNTIPLVGGLTNTLKMLLLGAILSFEEDRCFVVDETTSALPKRADPVNMFNTTFLNRYFEPIGLPSVKKFKSIVQEKFSFEELPEVRIQARDWKETWDWKHNRRIHKQVDTIPSLGVKNIPGHYLKRMILRRMWRPLPNVREDTCSKMEAILDSKDDFMAFSVRRGDKQSVEHFEYATSMQYIESAERAVFEHFDGEIPKIFVATDDCSVMTEFRQLRPTWTFVSECDTMEQQIEEGFRLTDMQFWTHEQTDAHFSKFFVELYAMSSAKYFIGVIYTNVTWWVLFMRYTNNLKTFELLETPGTEGREGIEYW